MGGDRSFGSTAYLLPHYGNHPAPWTQQAFTCCADLNGGSALFFGWSDTYYRQTSIYAFIEKFLIVFEFLPRVMDAKYENL
ncbi:MAG: hypothetical protein M3270_08180 [Thermoproteota archaeon]|nr:hypothetical protein [Thermoproteota archaeon]